jgi:hypothetical protein
MLLPSPSLRSTRLMRSPCPLPTGGLPKPYQARRGTSNELDLGVTNAAALVRGVPCHSASAMTIQKQKRCVPMVKEASLFTIVEVRVDGSEQIMMSAVPCLRSERSRSGSHALNGI